MDEAAKAESIESFEKSIYPIWRGIEERDLAEDLSRPLTDGGVMWECATMHKQDVAVYISGIKANRFDVKVELMADLRRKAARASGVGQ